MQIGADIYCDSQCIIRELERRHPHLPFSTSDGDLMWCLSRWTDGPMFELAVKLVLGAAGDALPKDFAEDRGRLYLGIRLERRAESCQCSPAPLGRSISHSAELVRMHQLSDNRDFLLGQAPAAIDAQLYHISLVHSRPLGPWPCLFVRVHTD